MQATATAKPHDKTVEMLNVETERQDSSNGQYIWRTVQDDHVRSSHRQREGQVFSWNAPPEGGHPGEDYNCRCWAEPITDAITPVYPELFLLPLFRFSKIANLWRILTAHHAAPCVGCGSQCGYAAQHGGATRPCVADHAAGGGGKIAPRFIVGVF